MKNMLRDMILLPIKSIYIYNSYPLIIAKSSLSSILSTDENDQRHGFLIELDGLAVVNFLFLTNLVKLVQAIPLL